MKILLLGSNGQLGQSIAQRVSYDALIPLCKDDLDISDKNAVNSKLEQLKPDIVVNAAAFTDVNLAEIQQEKARQINTNGPKFLVNACKKNEIPIIHISTDYVFDGKKLNPYIPLDQTNPISIYGKTKLDGEIHITKYQFGYVIRTAWLFSEFGTNFFKTMLSMAKTKDNISVVSDEFGSPTYAGDLADIIIASLDQIILKKLHPGIYHFASKNPSTWFEFAKVIFKEGHTQKKIQKIPFVSAISSLDYDKNHHIRPKYSVLDSTLITDQLGIAIPDWKTSLSKLYSTIE